MISIDQNRASQRKKLRFISIFSKTCWFKGLIWFDFREMLADWKLNWNWQGVTSSFVHWGKSSRCLTKRSLFYDLRWPVCVPVLNIIQPHWDLSAPTHAETQTCVWNSRNVRAIIPHLCCNVEPGSSSTSTTSLLVIWRAWLGETAGWLEPSHRLLLAHLPLH